MNLVVSNSKIVEEKLANFGVERSKIIQVYNAPFTEGKIIPKNEARIQLHFTSDRQILMYIGKIYKENTNFFFSIAEYLKQENFEIHIIGGNPKILKYCEEQKQNKGLEKLFFHGFIAPSEISHYTSASDFLFCSFSNHYPLIEQATPSKYFDYMYAQRPMIISENTAIRELFKDGQNCIFFRPDDADDFIKALNRATRGEVCLFDIVNNNMVLIEKLSWKSRTDKIISAYRALSSNLGEVIIKDEDI